jgi:hypothetical protein
MRRCGRSSTSRVISNRKADLKLSASNGNIARRTSFKVRTVKARQTWEASGSVLTRAEGPSKTEEKTRTTRSPDEISVTDEFIGWRKSMFFFFSKWDWLARLHRNLDRRNPGASESVRWLRTRLFQNALNPHIVRATR